MFTNLTRTHHLLSLFFGDETLSFHSSRLHHFLTTAFAEPDDEYKPNIPRLLHTQNDLLRLLDAAYLIHQGTTEPSPITNTDEWEQINRIHSAVEGWEDFPSHLHSSEWSKPESVLEEFFDLQSVDEWKDTVMALLQSAIGEGSPSAMLTDLQCGFAMIMLHRLLDAVWLLWIMGEIKEEDDNDEISVECIQAYDLVNFFFIDWKGKFLRVDLDQIRKVEISEEHMKIFIKDEMYQLKLDEEGVKELLTRMKIRGIEVCPEQEKFVAI